LYATAILCSINQKCVFQDTSTRLSVYFTHRS